MNKRIRPNQLHELEHLPKREPINNDPDRWHWHGSYTRVFWNSYKHAVRLAVNSNGKSLNEITSKIYKLVDKKVPHSKVVNFMFRIRPDRNGDYFYRANGNYHWNWFSRGLPQVKIDYDGKLILRPTEQKLFETDAEWRQRRSLSLQKKRAIELSWKRKKARDKRLAKTGCGSMHKKDIKVEGYTKADRFYSMLCDNNLDILLRKNIVTLTPEQQAIWNKDYGLRNMRAINALDLLYKAANYIE